tara:strand:- start:798 stop:995 length:198 start_codon:yes stop_codon:yes gene_type:complete
MGLKLDGIKTALGKCPHCFETTVLVSIVTDYYRCSMCGEDIKQHINGSISYLPVSAEDLDFLREE